MEVFTLLKSRRAKATMSRATAIEDYYIGEDDGPFFDLEFPLPGSDVEETKLVVGLKKPKPSSPEHQRKPSKFLVRPKRTEELPVFSLFTRENSTRSFKSSKSTSSARDSPARVESKVPTYFVLRSYLSKIKPLYDKASKAYGAKLIGFSRGARKVGPADGGEPSAANVGALPARLKVAARRLRKSRSASSAVAGGSVRLPPQPLPNRRDDSLLEQEDGIQSAIAHCKSSFNKVSETPLFQGQNWHSSGAGVIQPSRRWEERLRKRRWNLSLTKKERSLRAKKEKRV